MSMPKVLDTMIAFVSHAVGRIFGLDDDAYPATGVQPFSGDVSKERDRRDW